MNCQRRRLIGIWICVATAACRMVDLVWVSSDARRGCVASNIFARQYRFRGCCIASDLSFGTKRHKRNACHKKAQEAQVTTELRKGVSVLGVPLGYGASMAGVDIGPAALRVARLHQRISRLGYS